MNEPTDEFTDEERRELFWQTLLSYPDLLIKGAIYNSPWAIGLFVSDNYAIPLAIWIVFSIIASVFIVVFCGTARIIGRGPLYVVTYVRVTVLILLQLALPFLALAIRVRD